MPFLGQDWRSPGWSWIKTEDGWKRIEFYGNELGDNNNGIDLEELCDENKENLFTGNVCEVAAKKRKKDFYNNNTKSQFVYQEKWIYVQKESTRERHGYCTLGEAFNRLDFSSATQDIQRFTYVAKLLQLIARSQLPSLSGAAQKNYFNVLEKIVRKVLEDHHNPRLIKELLQDLSSTLCILTRGMGKSVLVGNINIWVCRLETILNWQQQLNNLQIPKQLSNGITLRDLPLDMQNNILYKFADACDIINLGQATPTLHMLSEDRHLWKKLCQFHFAEKQFCRHLILSERGHVDWKLMYFTLQKYYPKREQYGDTLHFCRHCSILFWKDRHLALLFKDSGHPCTANDPDNCLMPVSPQHFIDLFKF
ncbi:F-box only protein 25 isoform X1 [Coregonus clupeaformis]|uniref:F-box only protein 25 isoform X1 n=1 Tax=Coregonus clupeaformis TaxID=59861 RepID=UPI001BDFAD93|nr:F-box only protein 25 isoform X1 [Coregonus clupeaformis]XP_041716308.1 F-box only protein 25 isoform X1 [Coregonus clupeaformis]